MAKLSAKDRERLEQLRASVLDEKGDYRVDADFDELQELAKLEAMADDKSIPKVVKPESTQKETHVVGPKKKAPRIVKKWLERGFDYYGVDKNGTFILYNKDEELFYRLNRDPNFVDALAEGLPAEYLEGLK